MRVRAEDDHLRPLALCQCRQALGGGAIGDDVLGGGRVAEQLGAALEQCLCLVLGDVLARAVGLRSVADVGEGDLGAGAGEELAESDRVVLVSGPVIGNDDLG